MAMGRISYPIRRASANICCKVGMPDGSDGLRPVYGGRSPTANMASDWPPSVDVLQKSALPACEDVQVQSNWRNQYKPQSESEVFYPSGSGSPPKDTSSVPGPIAL